MQRLQQPYSGPSIPVELEQQPQFEQLLKHSAFDAGKLRKGVHDARWARDWNKPAAHWYCFLGHSLPEFPGVFEEAPFWSLYILYGSSVFGHLLWSLYPAVPVCTWAPVTANKMCGWLPACVHECHLDGDNLHSQHTHSGFSWL